MGEIRRRDAIQRLLLVALEEGGRLDSSAPDWLATYLLFRSLPLLDVPVEVTEFMERDLLLLRWGEEKSGRKQRMNREADVATTQGIKFTKPLSTCY